MRFALILIMMIASLSLSAETENELVLMTDIPEDYAVEFPDAKHIDHLYFSTDDAPTERNLVRTPTIDVGATERGGDGYYELSLFYYGNLSSVYDVVLSAESYEGFTPASTSSGSETIPLGIRFEVPDAKRDEIEVNINTDGSAHLRIEPSGPMRGLEVLDMVFTWEVNEDAMPGEYMADVYLKMETF